MNQYNLIYPENNKIYYSTTPKSAAIKVFRNIAKGKNAEQSRIILEDNNSKKKHYFVGMTNKKLDKYADIVNKLNTNQIGGSNDGGSIPAENKGKIDDKEFFRKLSELSGSINLSVDELVKILKTKYDPESESEKEAENVNMRGGSGFLQSLKWLLSSSSGNAAAEAQARRHAEEARRHAEEARRQAEERQQVEEARRQAEEVRQRRKTKQLINMKKVEQDKINHERQTYLSGRQTYLSERRNIITNKLTKEEYTKVDVYKEAVNLFKCFFDEYVEEVSKTDDEIVYDLDAESSNLTLSARENTFLFNKQNINVDYNTFKFLPYNTHNDTDYIQKLRGYHANSDSNKSIIIKFNVIEKNNKFDDTMQKNIYTVEYKLYIDNNKIDIDLPNLTFQHTRTYYDDYDAHPSIKITHGKNIVISNSQKLANTMGARVRKYILPYVINAIFRHYLKINNHIPTFRRIYDIDRFFYSRGQYRKSFELQPEETEETQ